MAAVLSNLTSETQLTTTETSFVVTGSSEKAFIGKAVFTNTSSSNVEVTIWRLATATTGTTGSGGNFMLVKTIPANTDWICNELSGTVLGNSMKLSGKAAAGAVINVNVSGTIET